MNARAKTAILPWLMAATVVLAVLTACASLDLGPGVTVYDRQVRCGVLNAEPIYFWDAGYVLVTTDEGYATIDLHVHECPPQYRARRCASFYFPPCKRA